MNNRRLFLWKLIYSFLLALLGPTLAAKFCGNPISPTLVGYKMKTKWAEGIIYAPYIPLYVTDTISLPKVPKWSKEDENYLLKANGISPDERG